MNRNTFLPILLIIGACGFLSFKYLRHPQHVRGMELPPVETPTPDHKPAGFPDSAQSRIQILFALDATGSMSGLIGAAKEKIWSIAGSLAQADPAPSIQMGLLFYRDRGDDFVTRLVPLSGNLDDVYADLMTIAAAGGGDTPESVNQGLYESITKFAWDTSASTYKTIFLVGDCPPQMKYQDDVKYPVSCELAKKKDIILNTILMGDDLQAKKVWKEIAACNQGSFVQVNMAANDIQVNTPYDAIIARISDQLDDSRIYYGNSTEKLEATRKISKSKEVTNYAKDNVKAQRAEYNYTKSGNLNYYGKKELLEETRAGLVVVDSIRREHLPAVMKNMTAEQKKAYVQQKLNERDSLQKELVKYSALRQEHISRDLSSRNPADADSSFSNQIYKSIRKQTEKKKIYLRESTKY